MGCLLRCYLQHERAVTPVHPSAGEIEGLACVTKVSELGAAAAQTAISIVTPPKVSMGVVADAAASGVTHVWFQPGSDDAAVLESCAKLGITAIAGGPCLLVHLGFTDSAL